MESHETFTAVVSQRAEISFQRIQTRLAELNRFHSLQQMILAILAHPVLTFVEERWDEWDKAAKKLEIAGLISDIRLFRGYREIIARRERPLPFLTAPGSRMNDHHSYPGGLVIHTASDIELALRMDDVQLDDATIHRALFSKNEPSRVVALIIPTV